MHIRKFNPATAVILVFVIATALIRVILNMNPVFSAVSNFSPVGAMALFGSANFNNKIKACLFPLLAIWLSDVFINRFVYYHEWKLFYNGFYWVYGALLLMVIAGNAIIKKGNVKNILLACLAAVFIHWIITDIGVFIGSSVYPKTVNGWWACLAAAIPFEKHFLLATIIYSAVLFGLFEWVKKYNPALQAKKV